jgi:pyrroline-5-carboxylate reductase
MGYQLGVIGAGNMAEAILRGLLKAGILSKGAVVASDTAADRRQKVSRELGVTCVEGNHAPAQCPSVLLAVKPQVMGAALADIAPVLPADSLVISIAAGIRTSFLDEHLGRKGRIVRVMPNTPMLVGAGVSAICAGPRAREEDLEYVQKLFSVGGSAVLVAEEMMDAVTAVSGSGPAYFFFLVEAMIAAGVAEGLPEEVAVPLAIHTCLGAGKLMVETGESPESLRAKVTSPNGTTQRAIETMESTGVHKKLVEAIRAAAARSREMGK